MVEAHYRRARRIGLTEAEFWGLTPYRLSLLLQEAMWAQVEAAWHNALFAGQHPLKPLSHYTEKEATGAVDEAEALRDWAKRNDAKFARPEADPQH